MGVRLGCFEFKTASSHLLCLFAEASVRMISISSADLAVKEGFLSNVRSPINSERAELTRKRYC